MALIRTLLAVVMAIIALVALIPLLVVIFPFWLISVLTRGIARIVEPDFLTREGLTEFDRVCGWRPRPNLDTHHLMVDLFHIRTDQDGWRGNHRLHESDIVIFGDSFAAGYGVADRHFFANLAGKYRIKSIGIGGYSMVQELLWMERLRQGLRQKLVFWFVYYGNDLYDNLMPDLRGYRKPFVREDRNSGDWEIVSSHVTPDRWPIVTQGRMLGQNHMPKLAELCCDTFLSSRAYRACEYLIAAGKQICDNAGADLVVLGIPDAIQLTSAGCQTLRALSGDLGSFDPAKPDKELARICENRGVQFRPGRSFLDVSCYKINDCHWNETGHRRIRHAIENLAEETRGQTMVTTSAAEADILAEA